MSARKVHTLKCWPAPFQAISSGRKRFEFRKNDRDFQEGDILKLMEWNPETREYTHQIANVEVLYILREGFGLPDGFCIMSIG